MHRSSIILNQLPALFTAGASAGGLSHPVFHESRQLLPAHFSAWQYNMAVQYLEHHRPNWPLVSSSQTLKFMRNTRTRWVIYEGDKLEHGARSDITHNYRARRAMWWGRRNPAIRVSNCWPCAAPSCAVQYWKQASPWRGSPGNTLPALGV